MRPRCNRERDGRRQPSHGLGGTGKQNRDVTLERLDPDRFPFREFVDATLVNPERPEHADIVEAEIPIVVVALRERHALGREHVAKRLKVQRLAVGDDAVEIEDYRA